MMCKFCVMDESDPEIKFDDKGECNHCRTWNKLAEKVIRPSTEFVPIAEKIQKSKKRYNCILGISGGVDSSYTAFYAYEIGLRPLLVHLDNGFDTFEAESNIARIRDITGWEMITVYADDEYYDIQKAYLKAGVANIEAVTDHAISALVYRMAIMNDIRYVLSGSNWATEGILPKAWGHSGRDLKNIKAIHKAHGEIPMERFIRMSLFQRIVFERFTAKIVKPLNYIDYNRERAKEILSDEWGLLDYGGKHGENALTRFYQNYILPIRWGVDKRRAHLSTLICSGQITRVEALEELDYPAYVYKEFEGDKRLFLKKIKISEGWLEQAINAPYGYARDYPNDEGIIDKIKGIRAALRGG